MRWAWRASWAASTPLVSESEGPWRAIGSFDEPGPIAGDVQVLPFESSGGPLRVRLRQSKGHWRLDQVALARLSDPVVPRRLEPVAVERDAKPDAAVLERLRRGERHLVTGPGDAYRILFELPASPLGLELFLESEGYYYEWMREEWLAEENAEMASLALSDPRAGAAAPGGGLQGARSRSRARVLGEPVPEVRAMKPVRRALAAILAAALAPGCASTLTLQDVPVVGREVTVEVAGSKTRLKGELLVVDKDTLWIRTEDGVRELRLRDVHEVRVQRHGFGARKALTWALLGGAVTAGGLAAACSSVEGDNDCGGVGLVVGGLWLLAGALTAPALESSSRIEYPQPSADTLRPFARLPQGLPPGVAPASLASPPPSRK